MKLGEVFSGVGEGCGPRYDVKTRDRLSPPKVGRYIMDKVDLHRYEATGLLGSGADYEVRSAVDRDSGQAVVLRRPMPQTVIRGMHGATEGRTERVLQAYQEVGHTIPLVVPILGYTDRANQDWFYGDSLGQEYRVVVEERAKGIPLLVGEARARITGVPVGAAQNLFALFPLFKPKGQPDFPIHQQILDLEDSFLRAGYFLLDLLPQNIFYQPASGRVTIIDCGALAKVNGEHPTRGRPPPDIHDVYLEILKYYATPQPPPSVAGAYRDPHGLRPVVRFDQELQGMASSFEQVPDLAQGGGAASHRAGPYSGLCRPCRVPS